MFNIKQIIDTIDAFNEDHFLKHGNSEIIYDEHRGLFVVIEGLNHTTLSIMFDIDDIEMMKNKPYKTIVKRYSEVIESFDVDEVFTMLWSDQFAKHNGFTPRMFLNMLEEDAEQFKEVLKSA